MPPMVTRQLRITFNTKSSPGNWRAKGERCCVHHLDQDFEGDYFLPQPLLLLYSYCMAFFHPSILLRFL
jgi:hypothetical protein